MGTTDCIIMAVKQCPYIFLPINGHEETLVQLPDRLLNND
jgi:hypothetical protein